jgi:hypothetical protein
MGSFTVEATERQEHGWTIETVLLIVQAGRGVRQRLEAAIAYGCGYCDGDVELDGDGPGSYRTLLRTLRQIEFGESDDIRISREYSLVQHRFIYRAEYRTHRHSLDNATGMAVRRLRVPCDRHRSRVKVIVAAR